MYQSTQDFDSLIKKDTRTFQAILTVDDTIISSGIRSIKLNGGSNRSDDFAIGSAVSQYVEISVADTEVQFENKEILPQIGSEVNGIVEYIPIGYFTAEKPEVEDGEIKITAYDRMMKMERPCFLDLPDDTTTVAILHEISRKYGVDIVTSGLSAKQMKKPNGYTCREVLSYIAQIYGGFAICNRQGQIEIRTYSDPDYTIGTNRYWDSFTHNDFPYVLEKITVYTGKDSEGNDTSVSVGSGARELSFSNPFMTQELLNSIWVDLEEYTYMPGKIRFMGDPRIDPWDILTVTDKAGKSYKVPVMSLTMEFDGGLTTEVEAFGKAEIEQAQGFQGPQTHEMDRYYADLVILDQALINKLDVDTAKITYATITNLDATNAHITNLESEYGDFKNLTADNFSAILADIDVLNADSANIKSLLAGNAGVGDLQNIHLTSANAVIDSALIRNAVMQTVTVGDLLSGTISTNKFTIASDDGGITIKGATQQWKDENGTVRVQIGKDANGDFTFSLFDETGTGVLIDSTGIKPGAIADGLIVNDMVADNANIAGSKLDIESVFTAMNGSTEVLNSSRIWFDEQNQSLNQVYAQMSNDITMAGQSASEAQEAAEEALNAIKGIDTLDAISAVLSNDAHVVHTNTDGSGGDYSDCNTRITVFSGDVDVSSKATYEVTKSSGVTGTWNAQTRTYQVTGMTTDDGWVDIDALYGTGDMYLTDMDGNKLTTRDGKYLVIRTGGAHIKKRFSISKAPDGKIGVSYSLKCSTLAIRKEQNGTFLPSSVVFTAQYNDGTSLLSYAGRFKIEESTNGTVTLTATVYKKGEDVTKTFNSRWFTWYAKSESGEKYVGYGYSVTVNKNSVGFGSTYIGRFTTYDTKYLTTRSGAYLTTRTGNRLTTWVPN